MLYIVIGIVATALWMAYEVKNAPYYDEDTKTFHKKRKK